MMKWGYAHCECCQRMLERFAACPFTSCVVLLFAALFAVRLIVKLVGCLCRLAKHFTGGKRLVTYGEWAVITGASDGIGKAMAKQLVGAGFKKLLLIARNDQKLKDVATELELVAPGPITVSRLVVDFAKENSDAIFSKVSNAVEGLSVGVLVNNVGVSYPHALYYEEVPVPVLDDLVNVNVRSFLLVTRAILPGMKARKQGLIVCVGSGSSQLPSDPLYAAYAATKAASEVFCRSLQVECASSRVQVQCHVPLLITTKLSKCKTPSLMRPSPDSYAVSALRAMAGAGTCCGSTVCPYFVHSCVLWALNLMPRQTWNKLKLGQGLSIRERALKKKEEEKKVS